MANCASGSCHGEKMGESEAHEKHDQLEVRNNLNSDVVHTVSVVENCVSAQHLSIILSSVLFVAALKYK